MKTENRRNTRNFVLPTTLLATAFVTALATQGAFAMVTEHDRETRATEASESGVLIVSGQGPRGDVKYVRPDTKVKTVGYEIGGPVGRLVKNPAE
ncbi:hypothetical protein [Halofilum ochraceum]|uniref:hypothetical protein n=1 Tax=Halofilum ochraceum TaxID=1611323 RepID=UPI00111314AA|nr:hypothetical protein [Halofilum ochraceum]